MSTKKTYKINKEERRFDVNLEWFLNKLYDNFIKEEVYCMTHLDEDLTDHENTEASILEVYKCALDNCYSKYTYPYKFQQQLDYMEVIVTKVCH